MTDTSAPARIVGHAGATTAGRNHAWRMYLDYKEKSDESYSAFQLEMKSHDGKQDENDLKGETVTVELIGLQTYLIEEDIKNKSNPTVSTATDTLAQYFGQVKEILREMYPKLKIWDDHEKLWYSDMRKRLLTGVGRRLIDDDANVKDLDTRAIVRKLKPDYLHLTQRQEADGTSWEGYWKDIDGRDLVSMAKKLISGTATFFTNPYEWRLILITLYLAGGRGGEPKHLKYNKMAWDEYFKCLTGVWTQVKQLTQKDVPFVSDPEYYATDMYHAFGCFVIEGGLRRTNPSDPRIKCIFPSLQSMPNEAVTRKVTSVVKKLSDEKCRKWTSAKGFRKGFNTSLAANRFVIGDMHTMLSGHARPDSTESYVMSVPALTMVPARAIADWPNPEEMVYPPTLDALGAENVDKVRKFIQNLFYIAPELDDLRSHGRLTMLVQTALASIIMYHPQMEADYPNGNIIVEKVNAAAETAGISAEEFKDWSDRIKKRFELDNFPQSPTNQDRQADMNHVCRTVETRNRLGNRMVQRVHQLEAQLSQSNQIRDSLYRELSLRDDRDRERDANDKRRDEMLTAIMTKLSLQVPPPVRTSTPSSLSPGTNASSGSKRRRLSDTGSSSGPDESMPDAIPTNNNAPTNIPTINAAPPAATTAAIGVAASAVAPPASSGARGSIFQATARTAATAAKRIVRYGTKAKQDTTASDASITLADALTRMFERGLLHTGVPLTDFGKKDKPKIPFISAANQVVMQHCLLLVSTVWTDIQEDALRRKPEPGNATQDANIAKITKEIETAVMRKMRELEQKAVDAGADKITVAGDRAKSMVTGLGKRYGKYSKAMEKLKK